MKYFILFATLFIYVEASVPSYFDVCCLDNGTTACTLNNINSGFQQVMQGDDQFNIPSYQPVRIPTMPLYRGANGSFHLRAVRIYGLDESLHSDLQFNLTAGTYKVKIQIPQILILSSYEIDANIRNNIYKSFGASRITMVNVNINHSFAFTPDPEGFIFLQNPVLQYTVGPISYQLHNLAPQLNQLLNSASNNLNNQFKPFIVHTLNDIISWKYRAVGELVKITELFNFNCSDA